MSLQYRITSLLINLLSTIFKVFNKLVLNHTYYEQKWCNIKSPAQSLYNVWWSMASKRFIFRLSRYFNLHPFIQLFLTDRASIVRIKASHWKEYNVLCQGIISWNIFISYYIAYLLTPNQTILTTFAGGTTIFVSNLYYKDKNSTFQNHLDHRISKSAQYSFSKYCTRFTHVEIT